MYNADKVIIGAPSEVFIDGVNVGWTKGGVRFRNTKSYWYRQSLNGLGAEGAVKEDESFYISTVMVENLLDSVKKAWGLSESIDYSTPEQSKLQFGGSTTIPTHVIRFSGPGRRVVFYKAIAMDFGEIQYSRSLEVLTPVTFRVLLDTSKSVGNMIGYFLDGVTDKYSNLVCRATIVYAPGTKDLVSRVTVVYAANSKNLVCRVTVAYVPGTSNLVSRITVLKETGSNLVSRTTVTQGWLTSNLVSRVTVTLP